MTDNDLFKLLKPNFEAMLAERVGFTVVVKQSFQPTQQSAAAVPALYLFKVSDVRRGSAQRQDVYDPSGDEGRGIFRHKESQWYETKFQAMALRRQDPADADMLTASDLVNVGAAIIQSDQMMAILRAAGVGVLRVDSVRNPYIVNSEGQNEADPSFDFVLTYKREYLDGVPIINTIEIQILRV